MKLSTKILGIGSLIALLFNACSTSKKISAIKPLPEYKDAEVVYEKQLSVINLPIDISLADIQNQVNKNLVGVIYEDKNIDDDNVMLKVEKQGNIVVREKNGKIYLELPLKIWTKVRYGVEKLGIGFSDEREINLNGKIRLTAAVSLANWRLSTQTEIEGIDWAESPSITIAGQNVAITYLINPALTLLKGKLSRVVDENISKSVDLKPYVLRAVDQLAKPLELNKEYKAWLGISPSEFYTSKVLVANNKVSVTLGMKAYIETSVGKQPTLTYDRNKLVLSNAEKIDNSFSTNIAAFCTYEQAAAIVTQNFAGKEFVSGGKKVTVNKVDIWGREGKMILALNLSGSLSGDIYLQGVPVYDVAKKEITITQVDFILDSKQNLLKVGDWLVHDMIVKKIEENCKFSIAPQLADAQKMANQYLGNYEPVKGVKINGKLNELAPNKIILTPSAIVAMIVAKGNVSVKIEGLQ